MRLVIDCYDDTHYGSGTMEAMLDRAERVKELHRCLQGYRPDEDGELIREKSRFYTWSHGIKVYEMLYSVALTDIIQETVKADVPGKIALAVALRRREP